MRNFTFVLVGILLLFTRVSVAEKKQHALTFTSPAHKAHLLELYSTQNCSSCPPANKLVSDLEGKDGLWTSFVPLVLHVDYWDHLGWKDPYSDAAFTVRQKQYVQSWKSRRVYTPMFVLDGKEWLQRDFGQMIRPGDKVGILKAIGKDQAGEVYEVRFESIGTHPDRLQINGAILGNGIKTRVRGGENAGKTLHHNFLALEIQNAPLIKKNGIYTGTIKFKARPRGEKAKIAAVFWASLESGLRPLQATGGYILENISARQAKRMSATGPVETAIFAGGCFWCMEPPFEKLDGVHSAISGYTGGKQKNPTYRQVSRGASDHREAVKISYDPNQFSYNDLLEVFWRSMDPTDNGGQFADRGSQYTPAIFYGDESERRLAETSKKHIERSGRFKKDIVTAILKAGVFYEAEDYHQDYYKKNPVHYKAYRRGSGRDSFLKRTWKTDLNDNTKGKKKKTDKTPANKAD